MLDCPLEHGEDALYQGSSVCAPAGSHAGSSMCNKDDLVSYLYDDSRAPARAAFERTCARARTAATS
jgi:hypothetical protein